MTVPDVSVIVPVYNTMPYLRECLASLIAQTVAPGRLEVVAVDDGSTDGSGEELDRAAAEHPGLFRVLHQPNSGGPANPCNNGLDVATGRYVFFLGSDDHLDPEAIERMVAAADEWESDVLCCRLVGVGGRWVNQALYAETLPEVPFPGELLASALSNTKLFRRSVLEDHGIRFPEDLRVGSDQPFTIEAMLHARRVSVLADRPYYFAVKREGAENITYTSTWQARLRDLGAVVRRVAQLLPEGEGRDAILQRHFSGEVATLLRNDFGEVPDAEQAVLVAAVNELTGDLLNDGIRGRLRPLARLRYRLAAEGDLVGLRQLIGAEDGPQVTHLVDGVLHQAPLALADRVTDPEFFVPLDRRPSALSALLGPAEITLDGPLMRGSAPVGVTPVSAVDAHVTWVNTGPNRSSWGARFQDDPDKAPPRSVPATFRDGRLHWAMDLTQLPRIRPGVVACLRVDLFADGGRYRLPVHTADTPSSHFQRGDKTLTARVFLDSQDRALLEIERSN